MNGSADAGMCGPARGAARSAPRAITLNPAAGNIHMPWRSRLIFGGSAVAVIT